MRLKQLNKFLTVICVYFNTQQTDSSDIPKPSEICNWIFMQQVSHAKNATLTEIMINLLVFEIISADMQQNNVY